MKTIYHDATIAIQAVKADADNETVTGVGCDMKGYDNVAFLMICDDGNAANWSIKAASATDSAYSDAADLASTSVTATTGTAATGYAFGLLEIANPPERYIRPVVTVADITACALAVISIQYNSDKPVTAPTYGEFHLSPAEGTA